MSTLFQTAAASPFDHSASSPASRARTMAVIPADPPSPKSAVDDPMRLSSPPPPAMGPPSSTSPDSEPAKSSSNANGNVNSSSSSSSSSSRTNNNSSSLREQNTTPTNTPAGSAAQGPKVVQTAFIHKLYSMLEDRSIQHLISWSNNNDSFVMSPSSEFSKVLAQYFKHTNISSFVRQLNMYGFHKVSDVFHTGSAESAQWEFKHGNGSFKKGDLVGLRDIKRRASRHTLIHRDSFSSAVKPAAGASGPPQPATPAADMVSTDPDQRLAHLEYALSDVHNRLFRSEESCSLLSARCQALADSLTRSYQWINTMSGAMQSLLAPSDAALHADISNMQKEIARQLDYVRALEPAQDGSSLMSGRLPFYAGNVLDPPISPRAYNFPDSRRSSVQLDSQQQQQQQQQHVGLRPPVPPIPPQYATTSPRKFGSLSGPSQAAAAAAASSPGFSRPPPPSAGAHQSTHPLASVVTPGSSSASLSSASGPNLARRHTSADIREHGWLPVPQANGGTGTAFASSGAPNGSSPSAQWQPPSPTQPPLSSGDQHIRDQLARYEIDTGGGSGGSSSGSGTRRRPLSNQSSPPLPPPASSDGSLRSSALPVDSAWSLSGVTKFPRPNAELHSAPATRRSSMASNVHSLLNPTDTSDREPQHHDDGPGPLDDRKRKRLQ